VKGGDDQIAFNKVSALNIYSDLYEAVVHFGHIHIRAVGWLAEITAQHWNDNPERQLCRIGELMRAEELKAAGYPKWLKFGRDSYDALTDAGKPLADEAFKPTLLRGLGRFYQAREFQDLRRDLNRQLPFKYAKLIFAPTGEPCEAAEKLKAEIFRTAQSLRHLPLPECDRDVCYCRYLPETEWQSRQVQSVGREAIINPPTPVVPTPNPAVIGQGLYGPILAPPPQSKDEWKP